MTRDSRTRLAALSMNGMNVYYFAFKDGYNLGVINNTATGYALDFLGPYYKWTEGRVLSNPNDCVLGWNVRNGEVYLDTNELFYPRLDKGKEYFGRSGPYVGLTWNYHKSGNFLSGTDIKRGVFSRIRDMSTVELLYVDCFASLKNQLWSELYHIELDRSTPQEGQEEGEEVVSSTEVTNNSNQDQVVKVDLDAEMFSSMEMTHESKLHEFSQTKWAVHGSVDLRWLGKVLASFSLDGGYDAKSIKENFTRTGSVSVESKRTVYKLNQEIKVKARTKTQVFIKTRPIRGDTQFTAYYKLKPRTPSRMWTHERIIASMRRAGFEDWDKTKTENGSLVMPIRGQLAIETGFETVAEVVSTPLGSDSPAEVMRSPLMPTR